MRNLQRLLSLIVLFTTGCSFSADWIEQLRVKRAIARQDYLNASILLDNLVKKNPDGPKGLEAARQGARIAHLNTNNYPLAVQFYKYLIVRSPSPEERKSAQKFIAQIYFENLLDYDKAVEAYEQLLQLEHQPTEAFQYRLNLTKSHFLLNNLDQALNEIDSLLTQKLKSDELFEVKVTKANILVELKQLTQAATLWESILKDFPERSKKENVALSLVVCYEQLKEFGKAIAVLEGMKGTYANPDFLNLRIERLKERQSNQPGARGWKR